MKFNNYDEHIFKSIKTFYIQKKSKFVFILFLISIISYSLFDNYFFKYYYYRWFYKLKNIFIFFIGLLSLFVLSVFSFNHTLIISSLIILVTFTFCFLFSIFTVLQNEPNKVIENLDTIASSDQNTYDWKPFEQPDLPPISLINEINKKYNKDFTDYRTNFLVTNSECLYYNKFGKFPYNNNLIRPSYNKMKSLDPQNNQSFDEWKNAYYNNAQKDTPMRALILKSVSGTPGYELQGIKEIDFANKLYQGKLQLDSTPTIVGCKSDGKPYFKQAGVMDNDKSETDIYEAINKVYDIEFLESSSANCSKSRKLCTNPNVLSCPFKFNDELKNNRMSDVMSEYWNMNETQTQQFDTGCYTENCKELAS